jgi:hypothetical protein
MRMGAPWDFDSSMLDGQRGNGGYCCLYIARGEGGVVSGNASHVSGQGCAQPNGDNRSQMFQRLYGTPQFRAAVIARWAVVSPRIKEYTSHIFPEDHGACSAPCEQCTPFVYTHRAALARNHTPATVTAWPGNVRRAGDWLRSRTEWLDRFWG